MLQVKLLVLGAGGVTYGRADEDVELDALDDDMVEVVKEVGTAEDEVNVIGELVEVNAIDGLVEILELVELGAADDDESEEAAAGLYI